MGCITFLETQGLQVKARGHRVVISPRERVTEEVRRYVKTNRLNILAELDACDGKERRTNWKVKLPDYRAFSMIGQPMTYEEALEIAVNKWPSAQIEK